MMILLRRLCYILAFVSVIVITPVYADTVINTDPLFNEFSDSDNAEKFVAVKNYEDFGIGEAFTVGNGLYLSNEFEGTRILVDYAAEGYSAAIDGADFYVETEFDICLENIVKNREYAYFSLVSSGCGLGYENQSFAYIYFDARENDGKIKLRYYDAGEKYVDICKFEDNRWYRIKLVCHITDANNQQSAKYSELSVNGINYIEKDKYGFASTSANKLPQYDKISINNRASLIAIDNFTVRNYNSSDGKSPSVNKGKLVDLIRSIDKLPDVNNSYTEERAKLEEVYNNTDATEDDVYNAISSFKGNTNGLYKITNVKFADLEGNEVTFFNNECVLKSVEINNVLSLPDSVSLFAAVYDGDNRLINSKAVPIAESGEYEVNLDCTEGKAARLYLFDEQLSPCMEGYIIKPKNAETLYNGNMRKTDTNAVICNDGSILVPAKNYINMLGIEVLQNNNSYTAVREDNASIVFEEGSSTATVNGDSYALCSPVTVIDEVEPLIDSRALSEAFGCNISYDESAGVINITDTYSEKVCNSYTGDISFNCKNSSMLYELSDLQADSVDVYIRINKNYLGFLSNYEQNGEWVNSYKRYMDNAGVLYWKKGYTSINGNGSYVGGFSNLFPGIPYDVKIEITSNGEKSTYVNKAAFTTNVMQEITIEDFVPKTNGELMLVPTFENASYYIDTSDIYDSCVIKFKKTGAGSFKTAYESYYDQYNNCWRGSLTGLEENTSYDIRATLTNSLGGSITKTATFKTLSTDVPISKTITLDDVYTSGSLVLSGIKGTADGWIRLDGEGKTINVSKNETEAVFVSDCSYLIIDNLKIIGGKRFGINLSEFNDNIRILNCDISHWGRRGIFDTENFNYICDGTTVNQDAAIFSPGASSVVIERCYIHDTDANANSWNGNGWSDVHPAGPNGIYYRAKDTMVIRYNDIIGIDNHRFNDAIEGDENGMRTGGASMNTDIYGNFIGFSQDDCIELDGGQMNARVYNNKLMQSLCGISTAPNMAGPVYIFRNLITELGTSVDEQWGHCIKTGGSSDGVYGMQYVFNNTFDTKANIIADVGFINSSEYHGKAINNILVSRTKKKALENTRADSAIGDENTNNIIYGKTRIGNDQGEDYTLPTYVDMQNGDFRLAEGSNGINAGKSLAQFTADAVGAPDIGAFEYGSNHLIYKRPVDMSVSTTHIELGIDESREITVSLGNIEDGLTYEVLKNDYCDFVVLSGSTQGVANKNTSVKFTVKVTDAQKIRVNTAVVFRLSNGLSIPITVFCK